MLSLYHWWKEERPKRPDPHDASGWSAYCEEKYKASEARGDDPWWGNFMTDQVEDERSRNILSICHQLEKEQEEEDTAMLIRLIKIRQSLWT